MDIELTRRRLLGSAGEFGLAALTGGGLGALQVPDAEAAEFAGASTLKLIRKNITLGKTGVPLHLKIRVVDTHGKVVRGAVCGVWQCDASGIYSDESSENTVGQTYLRGVQLTDASGIAAFTTIYPGYYQGRTTHIHVKVHVGGKTARGAYSGGHVSHTGQLLFDDAISTKVYALAPYSSETVTRTLNTQDRIYEDHGGSKVILKLTQLAATISQGFTGAITLVVNPSSTPAAVGVN